MTPTEELILDVLAARLRTGETLWPFSTRHKGALERLEANGYIHTMSGNVEHTIRAYLTDKGRSEAASATYRSPIEQELDDAKQDVETLTRLLRRIDA